MGCWWFATLTLPYPYHFLTTTLQLPYHFLADVANTTICEASNFWVAGSLLHFPYHVLAASPLCLACVAGEREGGGEEGTEQDGSEGQKEKKVSRRGRRRIRRKIWVLDGYLTGT